MKKNIQINEKRNRKREREGEEKNFGKFRC